MKEIGSNGCELRKKKKWLERQLVTFAAEIATQAQHHSNKFRRGSRQDVL